MLYFFQKFKTGKQVTNDFFKYFYKLLPKKGFIFETKFDVD